MVTEPTGVGSDPLPSAWFSLQPGQFHGRWYLCLKLWKQPEPERLQDNRTTGAVDTGINPQATDSDGATYENPKQGNHVLTEEDL